MRIQRQIVGILVVAAMFCGLRTAWAQLPPDKASKGLPITGEILPGSKELQQLDQEVPAVLARFEVPGAAVAITHAGKLIIARGYGFANIETREPVRPVTRFDLASVSKSITAVAILKLVEEGRLRLDERVFELLGQVRAPPGQDFDARLRQVTIRMLLEHAGGWDRSKPHGDPITFQARSEGITSETSGRRRRLDPLCDRIAA